LTDLTNNITSEINSAKANLLGNSNPLRGISDNFSTEVDKIKNSIVDENTTPVTEISTQTEIEVENTTENLTSETAPKTEGVEEIIGPIKRKK